VDGNAVWRRSAAVERLIANTTKGSDMNKIVWLEDVSNCDYVRQGYVYSKKKKGKPAFKSVNTSRLVGYEELDPATTTRKSAEYRAIYTLRAYDRDSEPEGIYKTEKPTEAVNPKLLYGQGKPDENCFV